VKDEVYYSRGLDFACTRCSACCRGEPGFVFLSCEDLSRLLAFLSLDFRAFFRRFARLLDAGTGLALALREKPGCDCIFWSPPGCSVYEARPVQCSTYPFWTGVVDSALAWSEEAQSCPGIGGASHRSRGEIEDALYVRRAAGTILLPYGFDPEHSDSCDSLSGFSIQNRDSETMLSGAETSGSDPKGRG
jgi:hypothetical protein